MVDLIEFDSRIRESKCLRLKEIVKKLKMKGIRQICHADEVLREEREVSQNEFIKAIGKVDHLEEILLAREDDIFKNNLSK